jgi:hypothetical protein
MGQPAGWRAGVECVERDIAQRDRDCRERLAVGYCMGDDTGCNAAGNVQAKSKKGKRKATGHNTSQETLFMVR